MKCPHKNCDNEDKEESFAIDMFIDYYGFKETLYQCQKCKGIFTGKR